MDSKCVPIFNLAGGDSLLISNIFWGVKNLYYVRYKRETTSLSCAGTAAAASTLLCQISWQGCHLFERHEPQWVERLVPPSWDL
jgi:hypothetical protein